MGAGKELWFDRGEGVGSKGGQHGGNKRRGSVYLWESVGRRATRKDDNKGSMGNEGNEGAPLIEFW